MLKCCETLCPCRSGHLPKCANLCVFATLVIHILIRPFETAVGATEDGKHQGIAGHATRKGMHSSCTTMSDRLVSGDNTVG